MITESTSFGKNDYKGIMKGKVCVLLGSTSGIGMASAVSLAEAGAEAVYVNGRDPVRGQRAVETLKTRAPDVHAAFSQASMLVPSELDQMFEKIADRHGGLDVLVHLGTGGGALAPFTEYPRAEYRPLVEGQFLSFVEACRCAVPLMQLRNGGSIICVTSDAARVVTPGESVIGGALAAAVHFSKGLALEMGRSGIRVNAITPSLVLETGSAEEIMKHEFSRKIFERIEKKAPLGLPTAGDVAHLVTFLASPLSGFITGQVVSINGGVSIA